MTLFTPNYPFPYAELGDPPNGPSQEQALAAAIDTQLKATDTTVAANAATVTALGVAGTWVPVFTGMNNNASTTGTQARYFVNGKLVTCFVKFVPLATADLGVGQPAVTLPFAASGAQTGIMSGVGRLLDAAGANRPLWVAVNPSATTALILGLTSGLLYTTPGGAGYSWNNSSSYDITFTYERA